MDTVIAYQPLGYTIVTLFPKKEKVTEAGIIVPDSQARDKIEDGLLVVAVGPEVHHIEVGDRVIPDTDPSSGKVAIKQITIEGVEYAQLTKHQIVGKHIKQTDKMKKRLESLL